MRQRGRRSRVSCDPPSSPWDIWGGDAVGRVRLVSICYPTFVIHASFLPLTTAIEAVSSKAGRP